MVCAAIGLLLEVFGLAGSGFWGFGSSRLKFRFMRFRVSVTIGFVVGVLVVGGGFWLLVV